MIDDIELFVVEGKTLEFFSLHISHDMSIRTEIMVFLQF
jgi:hypothetical protein